jgi:hypothetical protein
VQATRICFFSWSPILSMLQEVCKSWRHLREKSAKRRVISECLGGEFDFLLIEAPLPRVLYADLKERSSKLPQVTSMSHFSLHSVALPGRVLGRYSFRDQIMCQINFWLIQIFFWKPNSRVIDVPPLCEMSFIQPVVLVHILPCTRAPLYLHRWSLIIATRHIPLIY